MTVSVDKSILIRHPVEVVWEFVGDFVNDARWRQGIHEARRTSDGPMGAGTTLLEGATFMGRYLTTHSVVTEYVPNRLWAFKSTSGPVLAWGTHEVEPADGGTRFTYTLHASFPGLLRLTEPLLARVIDRRVAGDLVRLKTLLENDRSR